VVTMSSLKRLSTSGIKEIASVLGGGIYAGSLVFIEGEAETGKSVLSQHIASDAVSSLKGEAVYYTTQKTVTGLLTQMKSLSLNMVDYFLTNRFQVFPIRAASSLSDNRRQLQRLIDHIHALDERFNLVLLDSLTPLMRHNDPKVKIDFFYQCKELCKVERSIVLVANPHVIDQPLAPRLSALTDYHLKLKSEEIVIDSEKHDRQYVKLLEVTKAHGVERNFSGRVRFEVVPQEGIHVIPFQELKV
jgi:archaellum biogenesis ATPase FlaH